MNGMLARRIGCAAWNAGKTLSGAQIHDMAISSLQHTGQQMCVTCINRETLVSIVTEPILKLSLIKKLSTAYVAAGVIDENLDRSPDFRQSAEQGIDRLGVCDVERSRDRRPPEARL